MTPDSIIVGDALETLRGLPDAVADCCITSPPYYGLRDYGSGSWEGGDPECDHRVGRFESPCSEKQRSNTGSAGHQARATCPKCGARRVDEQIGLEETPDAYIARLVSVFREVFRVLKPGRCCFLNLGDSYCNAGSRNQGTGLNGERRGGVSDTDGTWEDSRATYGDRRHALRAHGIKHKDLMLIPARVALALQADGWWVRNACVWHKPNGMPSSVRDRFSNKHESVFLLSNAKTYWFDLDAVREPFSESGGGWQSRAKAGRTIHGDGQAAQAPGMGGVGGNAESGANPGDVWTIPTQPYAEAHYAVFPEALVERCLLAGCPSRVCPACGAAWERVTEDEQVGRRRKPDEPWNAGTGLPPHRGYRGTRKTTTLGHRPTCDCGEKHEPGLVLDPFCGRGTVPVVAHRKGYHYIGIDLVDWSHLKYRAALKQGRLF